MPQRRPSPKSKLNISATLDREVVAFVDRLADKEGVSRSLVINKLLRGLQRDRDQRADEVAVLGVLSSR
ncbi:MAG: ribbon-helix-helix protein, CopG family [Planctomycetota bacterium]